VGVSRKCDRQRVTDVTSRRSSGAGNGNTRSEGQRCSGGEPLTPAPPRAALAFTFTVRRRLRAGTFAVSVPRYLTLDPSRSLVPQPAEFPLHYPLLVAHVVFGSVAMMTCGFQVWPSFRRHHPEAHGRMGRIYVFGASCPPAFWV
jgi:hypothetical protein